MNSGKLDNQLNLALNISEGERAETIDLGVGFDAETNTWELIVKYNGNLQPIRDELGISIVELMNEYAIITIKQEDIDRLIQYQQIEFVEKPKRLSFEEIEGIPVSCISPVQTTGRGIGTGQLSLFGNGVITAVIDSGESVIIMLS